jgi:hypothetical protein
MPSKSPNSDIGNSPSEVKGHGINDFRVNLVRSDLMA